MAEQAIQQPVGTPGARGRLRWLLVSIVLVLVAGTVWFALQRTSSRPGNFPVASVESGVLGNRAVVGKPAPDFSVTYPDGHSVKLSQLRGKPVLVNFWATWCGPCREETPEIVKVYQAHPDQFTVIAVNLEEGDDLIQPFISEFHLPYAVVRDPQGMVAKAYGATGLPLSIFVNAQGNISLRWAGMLTPDTIENALSSAS